MQRQFAGKPGEVERLGPCEQAPPPDDDDIPAPLPHSSGPPSEPVSYFAPNDQWRRPSDYVAHLAARFEAGPLDQETGQREPRRLKRDQVLFVAQFAHACNCVWTDEQNDAPVRRRQRFNILLLSLGTRPCLWEIKVCRTIAPGALP